MNRFLSGVARAVAESFELPEPIMEIGAYQVAGQESYTNLRNYFPGKEYLGVDMRRARGLTSSPTSRICRKPTAASAPSLP